MKWFGKELVSVVLMGAVLATVVAVIMNTDCLPNFLERLGA